jgi:hypothetical protein
MQSKPEITPLITEVVVGLISDSENATRMDLETAALLTYVQHIFVMREVVKERKQWEDDRQKKVSDAIAKAMKQWDDEHYPRLLQATWGWHPFYSSFLANPLCASFIPPYPLSHSPVEGWDVREVLLQQSHVKKVYPVPWSVLLLRSFLKYYSLLPPVLLHPQNGLTGANIGKWLGFAKDADGEGSRAWQQATTFLKGEGFVLFAGARPVDSLHQWAADVEAAWRQLRNPSPQWWAELRQWCNSTQFRAVQDMAFHEQQQWISAWVLRDPPNGQSRSLACYERWLQYREDLDIGYLCANPGKILVFRLERYVFFPISYFKRNRTNGCTVPQT